MQDYCYSSTETYTEKNSQAFKKYLTLIMKMFTGETIKTAT